MGVRCETRTELWKLGAVRCSRRNRLSCLCLLFVLILNVTESVAQSPWQNRWQRQEEDDLGDNKVHCSRARSRTARRIVAEYLQPFLDQEGFNMSTKCRLHPQNDMFREQEEQKETLRPTQWLCGYCKKLFRGEEYLDKHYDKRHHNLLDLSPNHCFADNCGALHCDFVNGVTKLSPSKGKCNYAAVTKNRHLCEDLAKRCFPPEESNVAKRLNEFFLHQFCDAHSCTGGQKYFPRGSGKQNNRALYFALSLFTIILLLIFYGAIYLYHREMSLNSMELKRLSKHSIMKSQKPKKF